MNAKELYQQAYHLQYASKNLNEAYLLYHKLLKEFPNEREAGYAKTQIDNIESNPGFIPSEEEINVKMEYDEKLEAEERSREAIENNRQETLHQKEQNYENFLITTGYNFEGYNIVKYQEVVSADVVMGTGFFSEFKASISDTLGTHNIAFANKIKSAKQMVLEELKKYAVELNCNALIGININIVTFANNMIGVSGFGTAVMIKPVEL